MSSVIILLESIVLVQQNRAKIATELVPCGYRSILGLVPPF